METLKVSGAGPIPGVCASWELHHQMMEPGASGPASSNSFVFFLRLSGTHTLTHSIARKTALSKVIFVRWPGHRDAPPLMDGYDLGSSSKQEGEWPRPTVGATKDLRQISSLGSGFPI